MRYNLILMTREKRRKKIEICGFYDLFQTSRSPIIFHSVNLQNFATFEQNVRLQQITTKRPQAA